MTLLTAIVLVAAGVVGLYGLYVTVWSLIATRKRYYNEYMARRHRRADD